MIKPMISMTLLSVLVSLVVGCETSNQNYSQSGRVVDVTKGQSTINNARQTVNNTIHQTAPVVSEVPVRESLPSQTVVDTPASAPVPIPAPAPNMGNQGYIEVTETVDYEHGNDIVTYTGNALPDYEGNMSGSLIGGVPDGPLPEVTQDVQAQANLGSAASGSDGALLAQATTSTSSGNWLLVDSAEANKDESNSQALQRSMENNANNANAATKAANVGAVKAIALPDRYVVVKGDTLYSIAFRYGLDYHALAKINKIEPPYNLALGQVLTLSLRSQIAPSYVVQKGDTLYSIARKNGQSVSFLAGVNNLEPPYNLTVGQRILLSRENVEGQAKPSKNNIEIPVAGQQSQIATTPTQKPSANTNASNSTNKPAASQNQQVAQKVPANAQTPIVNSKTRKVAGVTWSWPTSGKVIEQFSTAEQGNKGIDIAGNRGQAILSAADGQVVYSGNALRGFGNLIIINHNNEYLSAYAHNDVMLVKEGQKVKRGQHIARMGNTDTTSPRLHFEIRYRGQSVNPISYLPK